MKEIPIRGQTWFSVKAKGAGAEVDIFDEIGLWGITAKDFREQLEEADNGGPIKVNINSPGGSVFDGVAIYALLSERRERVSVHVYGYAASIASVIALAGSDLTMHDGSFFMIHDPWSLTIGGAEDHRKTAEILDKIAGEIFSIYSGRTALTDDELRDAMRAETWFTAKEAVDAGFASSVVGEKVAALTRFQMLDRFRNAPVATEPEEEETPAVEPEENTQAESLPNGRGTMEDVLNNEPQAGGQPAAVEVTEGSTEIKAELKAIGEEVKNLKDQFANISLGRKVMPKDPVEATEWLAEALLKGHRNVPQAAAATIGVGDGFGVPVPASEEFLINLNHYSIARRMGAAVRGAGAQQTKFTTSVVKNEAAIISESGSYAEKAEPTSITMDLYKVGGRYSLSEETDEDTILAEFAAFQREAAAAIAKGENHYFLDGSDSGEPSGLTQVSASVTAAAHNAVTFAELVELDESLGSEWDTEMLWDGRTLDSYRGPVYVMHPDTAASVRSVISGESNYVFTEDGMGRLLKLFGRPVIRDSHMPQMGTVDNIAIALVNFGAYLIGERRPNLAIRVGQDNDSHDITWDFNERVGGEVWDSNGVATLAMAATT